MKKIREFFRLSVEQLMNRRFLTDLRNRSYMGIFFIAFIGLITYFTNNFNLRHPELTVIFLGPLIVICSLRALHLVFFSYLDKKFPLANAIFFVATVMITAIVWGLGFVSIMGLKGEYPTQILMTMLTAGICSGGVVAYTPSFFLSFMYNVLIMWPTAAYMVLLSDFKTAGLLYFLFSIYLWVITLKGNQEYWTAIKNEELLRRQSVELEIMSRVDVLTGLFNRRYFEELFDQEWKMAIRNGMPLSMLVCDLDNFKNINDLYGHLAGDEIIRMTADNLKTVFKRVTDIVCRYGGEEFVVLLSMDGEEALVLAELMCRLQAEGVVRYKQNQLRTTISIGLASVWPKFPESKEHLLDRADEALYKAKKNGKNQVAQG